MSITDNQITGFPFKAEQMYPSREYRNQKRNRSRWIILNQMTRIIKYDRWIVINTKDRGKNNHQWQNIPSNRKLKDILNQMLQTITGNADICGEVWKSTLYVDTMNG